MPHEWQPHSREIGFSRWKCRNCQYFTFSDPGGNGPSPQEPVRRSSEPKIMTCEEYVTFQVQGE
jgi:hypothetical protein